MLTARCKFLTGAPEAQLLDFGAESLDNHLLPAFCSSSNDKSGSSTDVSFISEPSVLYTANWRLIASDIKRRSARVAIRYAASKTDPAKTQPPTSTLPTDDDDFIDQSLAALEALSSSQLSQHRPAPASDATTAADSSTLDSTLLSPSPDDRSHNPSATTTTTLAAPHRPLPAPPPLPHRGGGPVTDLRALPSAPHLFRLRPQTLTITLIAGLISISAPRTVHVRRGGGYDMEIVELVLGDETRAGFGVTAWLAPLPPSVPRDSGVGKGKGKPGASVGDELRTQLAKLRRGQVLYLSPLALTAYGGVVYGQTLNRRASGVRTRVSIVAEGQGEDMLALPLVVREKVKRVRAWVDAFVGTVRAPPRAGSKRGREDGKEGGMKGSFDGKRVIRDESFLPPDSQ